MSKEEMREGFEAWHCEQYKTKHTTGAPTRDMHNGVRAEDYGSKKQQALWECWQETGGDVAKVEALKDEIERIEAGQQPVTFPSCKAKLSVSHDWDQGYFDGWKACVEEAEKLGPLYTRSDAGEVELLNTVVKQQKNLIASLRSELRESYGIDAAVQEEHLDLEAAAKKLAACMDYPWEHMPEQGRASMREHAKAIVSAALSAGAEPTKPDQVVWIGMEDLPEHEVGARYRIILDDVPQECAELEKKGGKRWFLGDDSGTFPIDEIQAWLPIAEPTNKERAQ